MKQSETLTLTFDGRLHGISIGHEQHAITFTVDEQTAHALRAIQAQARSPRYEVSIRPIWGEESDNDG